MTDQTIASRFVWNEGDIEIIDPEEDEKDDTPVAEDETEDQKKLRRAKERAEALLKDLKQ